MIEVDNSHALVVIDECLESILNIAREGKEINFVHAAVSFLILSYPFSPFPPSPLLSPFF